MTEEEKGQGRGVGRPASASSPGTSPRRPEMKMRIRDTRRCDIKHTSVLQLGLGAGEHVARVIQSVIVSACVFCVLVCVTQ